MDSVYHAVEDSITLSDESMYPAERELAEYIAARRKLPAAEGKNLPITSMYSTDSSHLLAKHPANQSLRRRDAKVEPSAASGGVPEPTAEYMKVANEVPRPLNTPRHLLVVIDLNGTLLHRPSRTHPTRFIDRPNARLFLKYCIETFNVVIWSSARLDNVSAMCNALMTPELRKKCIAIWARQKFDLTPADFDRRVICYKRLTKLWNAEEIANSHPEAYLGRTWDQTNTVLIDDSVEKAKAEPFNLIEVPQWSGDMTDSALPLVHDYLNMLSQHSNVSACLRTNPFKKQLQAAAA